MPVPAPRLLRNTCTVAAMLGLGVVTGAFLAETSLLSFDLASLRTYRPQPLTQKTIQPGGSFNGYPVPPRALDRTRVHTRALSTHRYGL